VRKAITIVAVALVAIAAVVVPATFAGAKTSDPDVLYKSTVSPLPHNLPSQPFQAQQVSQFGNQVTLTKAADHLSTVVVTMSSWACQSGSWNTKNCSSTPGATFSEPITFNIYSANAPGSKLPGRLITAITKPFSIPYRPSASSSCTANGGWGSTCANGKAVNITFDFSSLDVSVPQNIVFGIVYNTSQYGPDPYGTLPCESTVAGCPYDSLNVALSQDPANVTKGSNPNPGKAFLNSSTATVYCDSGAAGTGIFRLDSPGTLPADQCWSVGTPGTSPYYVPAVQFNEQ